MPDSKRTPKTPTKETHNKLNIAFITTRFGHQFGGAEAYGVELMRELAKTHQITVIGYEYDKECGLILPFIPVHNPQHLPSWIRSYLFARQAEHILNTKQFDIVHSHVGGWSADVDVLHVRSAAYRWFYAPNTVHRILNTLSPRSQMYRWLEKQRIHEHPKACTVMVSKQIKEQIQAAYSTRFDFPVIPPGVHLPHNDHTARHSIRHTFNLQEHDRLCLLVAREPKRKGFDTLLNSLKYLPDTIKFLVVGVAPEQLASYERLAVTKQLHNRLFFVEQTPHIHDYYQAADIYVHPTLNDSFGMAPLEAMSHSLPVIMSNARYCGFAHYAHNQHNCLLLNDPRDSKEFAQALLTLVTQPMLAQRLAHHGRQLAQQFSWKNIANQFEQLYSHILQAKKKLLMHPNLHAQRLHKMLSK